MLEGAASCLSRFSTRCALTASTVTYDQSESTVPYANKPGLIARLLGVALEAAHAHGVRLLRT